MRIGVVSDTHNHLRNVGKIVELFNAARVERVVHTGDITQAKTVTLLGALRAPLTGVYGNNDVERKALETAARASGITLAEPPLFLEWGARRLAVVHDPLDIEAAWPREHDVILHGHNHRTVIERKERCLIFNPGECAGMLVGHNSVGVLDLETLTPELLHF